MINAITQLHVLKTTISNDDYIQSQCNVDIISLIQKAEMINDKAIKSVNAKGKFMKSTTLPLQDVLHENFDDYIFFYIQLVKQNTTIYTMPPKRNLLHGAISGGVAASFFDIFAFRMDCKYSDQEELLVLKS